MTLQFLWKKDFILVLHRFAYQRYFNPNFIFKKEFYNKRKILVDLSSKNISNQTFSQLLFKNNFAYFKGKAQLFYKKKKKNEFWSLQTCLEKESLQN